MDFKLIPDELAASGGTAFTKRKIRKSGEANVLMTAEKLLARFIEDGDEMLVSEMQDLIAALHRAALQVQRVKHGVLTKRLRRIIRQKTRN